MSCKTKTHSHNGIPVIAIIGDLAGSNAPRITKKILGCVDKNCNKVVADLRETTFIDSHGLGVLVYAWRRLEEEGHQLIFLDPPPFIQDIFDGTNLAQVLTIAESLESL